MGKEIKLPVINISSADKNVCIEKCRALCCSNMQFLMDRFEWARFIPEGKNAHRVDSETDLSILAGRGNGAPDAVYYFDAGKPLIRVALNGKCPNLLPDNRCGIYERRPQACINFQVAGEGCNKIRQINKEPILVIQP